MTFAFVAKHRHIWPLPAIAGNRLPGSGITWICEVLGVSRSGFHAWLRRPISERAAHDAKLVQAIDKSFKASDRTYGARRVWRDVLEDGLACGLHRIERLMRLNAMRARPKRRGKPKDDGERSIIADNIHDRLRGGTAEPLLQSKATSFKVGLPKPHGVRGPSYANLTLCPRNRQHATDTNVYVTLISSCGI